LEVSRKHRALNARGSLIPPQTRRVSLRRLAQVHERPLLVPDDDVRDSVAVEVCRSDLRADAGIVVDEVGEKLNAPFLVAAEFEPVDHRRGIGLHVTRGAVGPKALSHEDVLQAVPVDIGHLHGVELADAKGVGLQVRLRRENDILFPGDPAVVAAHLLVPDQPILMAVPDRHDVVEPVAVDVAGMHLACGVGELEGVLDPGLAGLRGGGLFPPAFGFQDIHPAVAVDVAQADAVGELVVRALRADGMKGPGLVRLGGIIRGVAQGAARVTHEVRPAVAVDVRHPRRFIVHHLERQVLLPRPLLAGRVLEPRGLLPRVRQVEDVGPTVAVEVPRVGQKVVGVVLGVEGLGRADLVRLPEEKDRLVLGKF
jgi:hypothetical protein